MLLDSHHRQIDTLRLSVTDRCDLRCQYCMPANMHFAPRRDLLTFDELYHLCKYMIEQGVKTIRLSGGEPLMRKGLEALIARLGKLIGQDQGDGGGGLKELTMTSNATMLTEHAAMLVEHGIKRINISLDSRNPDIFSYITRRNSLDRVLAGIAAADAAGLAIKLNMVALRDLNEFEIPEMIRWAHGEGYDISLIEMMPMGANNPQLASHFLSLEQVMAQLQDIWQISELDFRSSGPARYYQIAETGGRLGIISPLTRNFCADCRRLRIDAQGRLFSCLGDERYIALRPALRTANPLALERLVSDALEIKPARHNFSYARKEQGCAVSRLMSVTGG